MAPLRLRVSFDASVRVAPEHRRVWLAVPETAQSLADVQHAICAAFLQPSQRDVLLSIDGFTLLPSEVCRLCSRACVLLLGLLLTTAVVCLLSAWTFCATRIWWRCARILAPQAK